MYIYASGEDNTIWYLLTGKQPTIVDPKKVREILFICKDSLKKLRIKKKIIGIIHD